MPCTPSTTGTARRHAGHTAAPCSFLKACIYSRQRFRFQLGGVCTERAAQKARHLVGRQPMLSCDRRARQPHAQALVLFSRVGVYVRLPGVDVDAFADSMAAGGLLGTIDALSGGSISRVGVFSLGMCVWHGCTCTKTLSAMNDQKATTMVVDSSLIQHLHRDRAIHQRLHSAAAAGNSLSQPEEAPT